MGSSVSSILKIAAPVVLAFAAPGIGSAIDAGLSLGLGAAGEAALGGAVAGGIGGALQGKGAVGALEGAALGGVGGYATGGGFSSAPGSGTFFADAGKGTLNGLDNAAMAGTAGFDQATGFTGGTLPGAVSGATGALSGVSRALGGTGTTGIAGSGITPTQALSGAANIYSGIQGTQAAKDIAAQEEAANKEALRQQAAIYSQTSANLSPFITAGQTASSTLADLSGTSGNTGAVGYGSLTAPFTPGDLTKDPGYQFQLQQGTQALDRSNAASGGYFSGAALKAAQEFGQNLAGITYNDAFQRYLSGNAQTASILGGEANSGQTAATALGGTGTNFANATTGLLTTGGNIAGGSIQAQNNAVNQSLANALGGNVGGFTGGNASISGVANFDPVTGQPLKKKTAQGALA